jgi:hypothetical protein
VTSRPAVALTLFSCLVASVSFVGDITTEALSVFLLPGALVVGVLAALQRGKIVRGLVSVALTAIAAAELVNLLSGEFQGPAARTTLVAAAGTGMAVVLSGSRAPALFLIPLAGIVAGAAAFGAGGQVQVVAVITACLAVLALARLEWERRAHVERRRSAGSLLMALCLVGGVAVFAALFQGQHDERVAHAPLQQALAVTVTAPSALGLPHPASAAVSTPPASEGISPRQQDVPQPTQSHTVHLPARVIQLLGALLLVALAGVSLRVALSWLSWRILYMRLAREAGPSAAWLWAVAHLDRLRLAPPLSSSPDIIAEGVFDDTPEALREPVRQLAAAVAPVVYGAPNSVPSGETQDSWELASAVARSAWAAAGVGRRLSARWRLAPSARTSALQVPARPIGSLRAHG